MNQVWTNTALDNDGDSVNTVVERRTKLHWIYVHNDHTATQWIHVYDNTAAGTDPSMAAGDYVFAVPGDTAILVPFSVPMDTGLVVTASTTAAAGGSGATTVSVSVGYG